MVWDLIRLLAACSSQVFLVVHQIGSCSSERHMLIADKCAVASHQVDPGSVHLLRKLPASLFELHLTGKPDAWCAFQMPMHCSLQYKALLTSYMTMQFETSGTHIILSSTLSKLLD